MRRGLRPAMHHLFLVLAMLATLVQRASGQDGNGSVCDVFQPASQPGGTFKFTPWWTRGTCIHNLSSYEQCRDTLSQVLGSQDPLHQVEYSSSATVLALLPTIGALLGSPSSELWMLLKILPFGGALALLLSFGGPMVPQDLDNYKSSKTLISQRHDGADSKATENQAKETPDIADAVSRRVAANMRQKPSISTWTVVLSSILMVLLFCAVMAMFAIIEYGAVFMNWCTSTWWFHLWYLILTSLTLMDTWASAPFDHYLKVYISTMPEGYSPMGHDISGEINDPKMLKKNLAKMTAFSTKQSAITTASETTGKSPRQPKTVVVLISLTRWANNDGSINMRTLFQLFLKISSVVVYVFATSIFAAISLLALPMAQMILTVVVGAGILARFLTNQLAVMMRERGGCIHVIAQSEDEAGSIVKRIFDDQAELALSNGHSGGPGGYIVEINGGVFASRVFVGKRSPWPRRILGVLAPSPRLGSVHPQSSD